MGGKYDQNQSKAIKKLKAVPKTTIDTNLSGKRMETKIFLNVGTAVEGLMTGSNSIYIQQHEMDEIQLN